MNPGLLDSRVSFEFPTRIVQPDGSAVETWANLMDSWARVTRVSGDESRDAEGKAAKETAECTVRYLIGASLTTGHRVVWNNQTWNITGIDDMPPERPVLRKLTLTAVAP